MALGSPVPAVIAAVVLETHWVVWRSSAAKTSRAARILSCALKFVSPQTRSSAAVSTRPVPGDRPVKEIDAACEVLLAWRQAWCFSSTKSTSTGPSNCGERFADAPAVHRLRSSGECSLSSRRCGDDSGSQELSMHWRPWRREPRMSPKPAMPANDLLES